MLEIVLLSEESSLTHRNWVKGNQIDIRKAKQYARKLGDWTPRTVNKEPRLSDSLGDNDKVTGTWSSFHRDTDFNDLNICWLLNKENTSYLGKTFSSLNQILSTL